MMHQSSHFTRLPAAVTLCALTLSQSTSAFGADFVPSQLNDIPKAPIYVAIAVGLALTVYRVVRFRAARKYRARVFPKLTLRRRLFAPYSGGNYASTAFDSRPDA